ncbi:hypothetical protein BPOR_0059g00150 [Botrytis porri]|uniref:Uncharacterized protein n=1 Tax=Botrytis porri TaxID=87229 RepID=A0A4Z1L161_9HELO|nr:hypothetical protein BPOR_0059g00150 [Botrytis porri]
MKFTPLASVLFQYSLVVSAVLLSEYLHIRDAGIFNTTIEKRALGLFEIAMLNNLQNAYKGVWWATAYPNAERQYRSNYDISCDICLIQSTITSQNVGELRLVICGQTIRKTMGMDRQTDVQATTENLDLGDESTDPATLPKPVWPENCHGEVVIDADDTSTIVCDYVIPLGDESSSSFAPPTSATSTSTPVVTLPPDPKNCNCNEDGCTKESPACCAGGTC